jgi:hypothetical protein
MDEYDRFTHQSSSESAGRLSDPPVLPDQGGLPRSGDEFPEFAIEQMPEWALVEQSFDTAEIGDLEAAVSAALEPVMAAIKPGMRVCLATGSRGIDRIDQVVGAAVRRFQSAGANVFIVPAMGSHGGATPEGQLEVLAGYGITAESMGCEIRSSMETVRLGEVRPGVPVFMDRNAFEGADAIVPINRVKVHTDFSGPIESGLMKMIAIGLGKQKGADAYHAQGFGEFRELIPEVARYSMAHAPIPFGLALIENGHARLVHVEAVPAERIEARERELLVMATEVLARFPLDRIDVLILDEIGKDVSGLGMDSNVVGRYYSGPTGVPPSVQRIFVRDLTDATEGNAVGLGMADVVLRRAVEKIDRRKSYINCLTAKTPEGARVPLTVDCDEDALALALATCLQVTPATARIVRVRNTKHLDRLLVSEAALPEVLATGRCAVIRPLAPIAFDAAGMFADSLE